MARKLNVTSEITTITTSFKKYITEADVIGEAVSYDIPEIPANSTREETLKTLRKYDIDAVNLIGQQITKKRYGMTEEMFASIAYPIDRSKRHNLITRDKKNTYVRYQVFNVSEQKMDTHSILLPKNMVNKPDDKILEYVRKNEETANIRVLMIIDKYDTSDESIVYAVDRLTFINHAVVIDKKGNPIDGEQ